MRHLKFGIPIVGAIAFSIGLIGCADENPWGASSNEKGRISLALSTDSGIKTAKPVFRSGDESTSDPNDLTSYITVPKPEEFSIKLEKSDESFSKTWTSLKGFLNYTKENFFTTGAYTLTAYYGDMEKQDFNAPYFEASTTFNVLSDEVYEVNLVAELMNSMVKVNYTDAFRDYMSDFHSKLRTEDRADDIIFSKDEIDPAFIKPKDATLTVHLTTKDKNHTTDVKIGDFPPMAKTLHNITLDIAENENGVGQLQVIFDDTLDEEVVKIDLTDQLLTSEAPSISCTGFMSGQTLDVLENSAYSSPILMDVLAPGIVGEANLIIESTFTPSWGKEIDLCSVTNDKKSEIEAAFGKDAIRGFGFSGETGQAAVLNLTNLCKIFPTGTHTVSLIVTDKLGRISNTASVTFDSQSIEMNVVGQPSMGYCSKNFNITLDYNGNDPLKELSFKTTYLGDPYDVTVQSCEEVAQSRAIEKKQYIFELQLPDHLTVEKNTLEIQVFHNGSSKKTSGNVNVVIPEYNLEYDAFSKEAYVKINIPNNNNSQLLDDVINNFRLYLNGVEKTSGIMRFTDQGYIAVADLIPGTTYSITSSITRGDITNKHPDLTTESALPIPNGDFSKTAETFDSGELNVGGQWHSTLLSNHQHTSKALVDIPTDWATINELTAWSGAKNRNTWYVVPSSWSENGLGVLRNVGYNHEGPQLANTGSAGNSTYYCTDSPDDSELIRKSGELFLGSYSFNGSETRKEGIAFASRPSSISFDYSYDPMSGTQDKGYAYVELIDTDGNSLGSQPVILDLERGENQSASIPFEYVPFGKKAAMLKVSFKSSKDNIPPIKIPTGKELDEKTGLKSVNLTANSYHAVATGSVLKIDNVVAHYGDEETPANAPKRSTNKKR